VPLGKTSFELVAVVDAAEAGQSVFGRWVAAGATISGQPSGWAVRTDEIDSVGRRLALTVRTESRVTPSGDRYGICQLIVLARYLGMPTYV
jgi:hypothetical protein